MVKDIYSRKLVVKDVFEVESSQHACQLLRQGCLGEQTTWHSLCVALGQRRAMQALSVVPSYSRLRVSNDNAYAEALFRTAKYLPTVVQASL